MTTTTRRTPRSLPMLALLGTLISTSALAQRVDPFKIGGRRATGATVTLVGTEQREPVAAAPMAWALAGLVAELNRASMRDLFRSVNPATGRADAPTGSTPIYEIRLRAGSASDVSRILRDRAGRHWLEAREGDAESFYPMVDERFAALSGPWPRYRGSFEPTGEQHPRTEAFEVERPFESSPFILDAKTTRDRIFGRIRTPFSSSNVDLSRARYFVRLPDGYDPRQPAGLVVWVSPRDQWIVPESLHRALDEGNFVGIGALDSGNQRPPPDRMQLALHAVEIARARWHIDPRRVYVTGMSGGAKIATMLWAGFPEVFRGSIPIVGLGSYRSTPTGKPGESWPAIFTKPTGRRAKLFQQHRIAPMTGPPDFNYQSMMSMAKGLERDGLPIRMFVYDDMGHVMPRPDRFVDALSWVDEPFQDARTAEVLDAADVLDRYEQEFGDSPPLTDAQKKTLTTVLITAPWSEPAWTAYDLLSRAVGESGPSASP